MFGLICLLLNHATRASQSPPLRFFNKNDVTIYKPVDLYKALNRMGLVSEDDNWLMTLTVPFKFPMSLN